MIAGLILTAMLAVGCEDGGMGGDFVDPTADVAGQWEVTWTETSDSCGSNSNHTHSVQLSQNGSSVAWQDEGETCDPSNDFTLSGTSITEQSDGQFTGVDGCTYQENIALTLTFAETTFAGTNVTTYTVVAGNNCNDYSASPCQIRENVSGTRCQSCYSGCQSGPSRTGA